jgi:hypothetical protein
MGIVERLALFQHNKLCHGICVVADGLLEAALSISVD